MTAASPRLYILSPSLQVFLYLQLLDALTTLLGFRAGLTEASGIGWQDSLAWALAWGRSVC